MYQIIYQSIGYSFYNIISNFNLGQYNNVTRDLKLDLSKSQ